MPEALSIPLPATTRYELPEEGISLLGYVARRMHKTALLLPVSALLNESRPAKALAQAALYSVAASVSFGAAYYQPRFNAAGDTVSEADPATGAAITVRLAALAPRLRIEYVVELPDGSRLEGTETITGTTVGRHGLGMPAPSRFSFTAGDYTARMQGTIVSELVPGIFRPARIRAHGTLELSDNAGNSGTVCLSRDGKVDIRVTPPGGASLEWEARLASAAR